MSAPPVLLSGCRYKGKRMICVSEAPCSSRFLVLKCDSLASVSSSESSRG